MVDRDGAVGDILDQAVRVNPRARASDEKGKMPRHTQLSNKPLVEAIFEMRWKLRSTSPVEAVDPHYKLLVGRLYDRLESEFPVHEALPSAQVPDEMIPHRVQHRFRVSEGGWPLVQIGPGVMTVNSTDDYSWDTFQPRVKQAVKSLLEAYPARKDFHVDLLMLRHIDAVDFDPSNESVFAFLRDRLKVGVCLPEELFDDQGGIEQSPVGVSMEFAFKSKRPIGQLQARFGLGQKRGKHAIVWETTLRSIESEVPDLTMEFERWLTDAHQTTGDWFFKLIDGDLLRQFA